MPSHMSSIGFPMANEEDFEKYARMALENGSTIKVDRGIYINWSIENGVELWAQVDNNNNFIGLNPHFIGQAKMKVSLIEKVDRSEISILDGAFYSWADPAEDNNPESGCYPFVFDTPNFGVFEFIETPRIVEVQLSAFAHELNIFESDEAFDASQSDQEAKFAAESFIPSGLFTVDGGETEPPEALAIFSGHVLETKVLNNPITDNQFVWIKVETLGGEIDIVADPELVKEKVFVGGIVRGSFWLSGKLLVDLPSHTVKKKKSLLRRMFGK